MQEGPTREHDNAGKFGSGMTIAAWIIVLALATLYFDRFLDQQHNPNQRVDTIDTKDARLVTLQRNRQGHYVTTGEINGAKVQFLLDTGATDVSIPEKIARVLHLQKGPEVEAITANGVVVVYMTMLNNCS